MSKHVRFADVVIGNEGLLKGPFGSDLKKSLYVPKSDDTYKVYLQENILSETNDAGTHYISKEYFETKMSRYAVKENDFIITCDGTLGEIFQLRNIKEPGLISSSLLRVTLNEKVIDYDYFYYYWKAIMKKALITQANNSVLKHLPGIEVIRNYEFELPELSIQKEIAKQLKSLDMKIKINNHINSELESMAKTIYDYWFLQFEFPNEEGKPYKSSGGKMVWNDELKREVPEGWEVQPILDFCSWEGTSQPPKSTFVYEPKDGYIRFIQNRDYEDDTSHPTYIPLKENTPVCNERDILMDKYGDAGRVRFGLNGAYNVALSKIVVKDETLREYIRSFLEADSTYNYLHNSSMASTRASLNENNVSYLYLPVPPKELIDEYNKTANLRIETSLKTRKENKELASLRDFLLPMLMNGQMTFKEKNEKNT